MTALMVTNYRGQELKTKPEGLYHPDYAHDGLNNERRKIEIEYMNYSAACSSTFVRNESNQRR